MSMELIQLGALITALEAAKRLGVGRVTLARMRMENRGPRFVRLTPTQRGRVMYEPKALQEWIEEHSATSTTQETVSRETRQ